MKDLYTSGVMLVILGKDLDPESVTQALGLEPSQKWCTGERKSYIRSDGTKRIFDSEHEWGGWKRFGTEGKLRVEERLSEWAEILEEKGNEFQKMKERGWICRLDIYLVTESNITSVIDSNLVSKIAQLGVDLEFCFDAH